MTRYRNTNPVECHNLQKSLSHSTNASDWNIHTEFWLVDASLVFRLVDRLEFTQPFHFECIAANTIWTFFDFQIHSDFFYRCEVCGWICQRKIGDHFREPHRNFSSVKLKGFPFPSISPSVLSLSRSIHYAIKMNSSTEIALSPNGQALTNSIKAIYKC